MYASIESLPRALCIEGSDVIGWDARAKKREQPSGLTDHTANTTGPPVAGR